MIGSLRLNGSTACMTIEGPTDTEVFHAYVSQVLCPTLRPGDVVVLDNLSPHKSEKTLRLIGERGAQVMFLPAYSPDLSPIEKMWSKVKGRLRAAKARTPSELLAASRRRWTALPLRMRSIGLPPVAIVLFKML
jgi:transposase